MQRVAVCLLLLAQVVPAAVLHGEGTPQRLSLADCVSLALARNPLVRSAGEMYRASLARIQQAKALPQPSIDIDSDLQPGPFQLGHSGESYLGISQTFEFPGKRATRGGIAVRESQEALADLDLWRLQITYEIKEAFYGLLLAMEKLRHSEEDRDLANDFLDKTRVKFEAGDAPRVEVLRARVEASKAANTAQAAMRDIRLAKARLNYLLARGTDDPLEIDGEFKPRAEIPPVEELRQRASASRPEARRAQASVEKETLRRKQGYLSYLPDFDVGLSRHRIAGEESTWDFAISFPVPLFFWQPKRGEVREAEANLEAARREAEHTLNLISLEVEDAYRSAASAAEQIALFEEEMLSQAEEAYDMLLFSYLHGGAAGIDLIESRRTLIETRKSYADSRSEYSVALAALERAVGEPQVGDD
ncbi:MAG: TolC family protein [Acidobacteriota bacterium]